MTLNESPIDRTSLSPEMMRLMQAWWRAANFLSVGQIYLLDNPLLDEPLKPEHIKPRLLGHWGTSPGLNFIYVHLNRIIKEQDVNVLFIAGPGHGAPGIVANTWLEGTYSELYPEVPQDKEGMRRLFRQFSFPWWNSKPRGSGDAWLDPRRRRTRLLPLACLWSGVRQP